MHIMWQKLPTWVKSFYFLVGLGFLFWMFFFDAEDLVTQYKLRDKLRCLAEEQSYYLAQIEKLQQDRKELANHEDLLEKFAREKYFMKKETEDLYVIVSE
jgi:cell division protein DivIC